MRAGLIVAGVLLLIIGYFLTLTIIGSIIGIPIGLIGVIMVLVGLFTSGTKIVVQVTGTQYVAEHPYPPRVEERSPAPKSMLDVPSSLGKGILRHISTGSHTVDELVQKTGVSQSIIEDNLIILMSDGYTTKETFLTEKGYKYLQGS
jgi:hypothetical protein